MKLFGKGFRFGILLQVAIGPVFVFVLKTAVQSGRGAALAAALAATLVDAIFVTLAILGIGRLLEKPDAQRALKLFGAGAVTTTLVSLGVVAIVGGWLQSAVSPDVTKWLNVLVGMILIGFAIRMLLRRSAPEVVTSEV
jgi:threonine/homoserine/homoserine lactone efflux protein